MLKTIELIDLVFVLDSWSDFNLQEFIMNGPDPDQGVGPFDIFDGIEELKVVIGILDDVEDSGCV